MQSTLEMFEARLEAKHLAELLQMERENLARERKEKEDLKIQLRELQGERAQHLAEMRSLLEKQSGLMSWFRK